MVRTRVSDREVGWGMGLVAGAGAGLVAAITSVLTRFLMHALLPPLIPTVGSAFVAGLGGGLLYAGLTRVLSYPARALWVIVLVLATLDSILIATLPGAAGSMPPALFFLAGLIAPIRQVGALLGLGQFGPRRFPEQYLLAVTVIHYVTAVSVAILVPVLARRKPA
jgi:hypothetical protein